MKKKNKKVNAGILIFEEGYKSIVSEDRKL